MVPGLQTVTLSRDGPHTSWGFRLHGGKDIGYPMVVQRVFLGSPSEGELQRGDTLLQIQGQDTAHLTHMEAFDLIKQAGTRLQLLIRRLPGAPQPPLSPTSPCGTTMHPFAKLMRESEGSRSPSQLFQPMPKHFNRPTPPSPRPIREYCYSPLPTTPLPDILPSYYGPRHLAHSEVIEYYQEKEREKDAIVHQGHRTFPLIAPKPKTRHDIPMGSYLRFVHDPNWKGRSNVAQTNTAKPFFNQYPTPTYSTIGIDSRRGVRAQPPGSALQFERPLDEGSQLVHHQYNSPLGLYSQRNIDQTIKEQTGVSDARAKLNVGAAQQPSGGQAPGPLSPGATLARPGTKLTNIVDITLSPTFQMIQEAENRSSSPLPPPQHTPTPMRRTPAPGPRAPFGPPENPLGTPKEVIHQSGSFKMLMSQVYAPPVEHTA